MCIRDRSYLRQKGLSTVEDLEAFLESSGKSAADYRNQMKPKKARSKVIDGILASRTDCKECKPVYEKYQKIFFKKTKEKMCIRDSLYACRSFHGHTLLSGGCIATA